MKLQGTPTAAADDPRPRHRACWRSSNATVAKVAVTELRENTFHALITLQVDGSEIEIDSRPSDALALAVRTEAPIFVADSVLDDSAIEFGQEPDDAGRGHRRVQEVPREREPGRFRGLSSAKSPGPYPRDRGGPECIVMEARPTGSPSVRSSGVGDDGGAEMITLWIERKPGALWAVGRAVGLAERHDGAVHADDYVFEGYEMEDAVNAANEALDSDLEVCAGEGRAQDVDAFTSSRAPARAREVVLRPPARVELSLAEDLQRRPVGGSTPASRPVRSSVRSDRSPSLPSSYVLSLT